MGRKPRPPLDYRVISISPRLTPEERREFMERNGKALIEALGGREVGPDYVPHPPHETRLEDLGDSPFDQMVRELIINNPDKYIYVVPNRGGAKCHLQSPTA